MIHTVLAMAPMVGYLIVVAIIVVALAGFAVMYFDGHDTVLFGDEPEDGFDDWREPQ